METVNVISFKDTQDIFENNFGEKATASLTLRRPGGGSETYFSDSKGYLIALSSEKKRPRLVKNTGLTCVSQISSISSRSGRQFVFLLEGSLCHAYDAETLSLEATWEDVDKIEVADFWDSASGQIKLSFRGGGESTITDLERRPRLPSERSKLSKEGPIHGKLMCQLDQSRKSLNSAYDNLVALDVCLERFTHNLKSHSVPSLGERDLMKKCLGEQRLDDTKERRRRKRRVNGFSARVTSKGIVRGKIIACFEIENGHGEKISNIKAYVSLGSQELQSEVTFKGARPCEPFALRKWLEAGYRASVTVSFPLASLFGPSDGEAVVKVMWTYDRAGEASSSCLLSTVELDLFRSGDHPPDFAERARLLAAAWPETTSFILTLQPPVASNIKDILLSPLRLEIASNEGIYIQANPLEARLDLSECCLRLGNQSGGEERGVEMALAGPDAQKKLFLKWCHEMLPWNCTLILSKKPSPSKDAAITRKVNYEEARESVQKELDLLTCKLEKSFASNNSHSFSPGGQNQREKFRLKQLGLQNRLRETFVEYPTYKAFRKELAIQEEKTDSILLL